MRPVRSRRFGRVHKAFTWRRLDGSAAGVACEHVTARYVTVGELRDGLPVEFLGEEPDAVGVLSQALTSRAVALYPGHPGRVWRPNPQHVQVSWVGLEEEPASYAYGLTPTAFCPADELLVSVISPRPTSHNERGHGGRVRRRRRPNRLAPAMAGPTGRERVNADWRGPKATPVQSPDRSCACRFRFGSGWTKAAVPRVPGCRISWLVLRESGPFGMPRPGDHSAACAGRRPPRAVSPGTRRFRSGARFRAPADRLR